jgi:hypothetical protein
LPTSSFDMFFACTVIVAAALIGTAFLCSTMQTRIDSTQDINKDGFLKAVADRIVTNAGAPANWGSTSGVPVDFGLAASDSTLPYELDIDKITRLGSTGNYSLSYFDLETAAKLSNIALGITLSQVMTVNSVQINNSTIGSNTSFTFTVSTSINSKPATANLHCYIAANNQITTLNGATSNLGTSQIILQIPTASTNQALLIIFAQSILDTRLTSYAIYNFENSSLESTPQNTSLDLNVLNYTLDLNASSPDLTINNGYVFSYAYQQPIPSLQSSPCPIPKLIDQSPLILVVCGHNSTSFFQEWTAYPKVPLKAGADFVGSEQNVFSYIVTVNGVLYRLDLSLGALPQ